MSTARAASHVLLIAPVDFRANEETAESNVFQHAVGAEKAKRMAKLAIDQHRALRNLLIEQGVTVTVVRSRPETPDAPFCNNWFSTHPAAADRNIPVLVLYPMLAPNRRAERRRDIIALLKSRYECVVDFSDREHEGLFLESTGSLCLDDAARVAYATISPRTHLSLAKDWASSLGYRLVAFRATDAHGVPYYHTNVMMFIGHGLAGVCLESIGEGRGEGETGRRGVEESLRTSGLELLVISRDQVLQFCGNCLPLVNDAGDRLFMMSSAAFNAFSPAQRATIERHGRILHTDLSSFEEIGGGSARCLLGELF